MLVQLLLLLATLAATAVAVFSDTKHFERRRLTRVGALTLFLAFASSGAGGYLVVTQAQEQVAERARRYDLNRHACLSLHRAARDLSTSISRLSLLTSDPISLQAPPPPLTQAAFLRVASLNLFGLVGTPNPSQPLDVHVTDTARHAQATINGVIARYSGSLDPHVIAQAEAVLRDPFFNRLAELSSIMRVGVSKIQRENPGFPRSYWPLFLASEWPAYQTLQDRLDTLIRTCISSASAPAV